MSNSLQDQLKSIIQEVPDFPKPGISFKDITPILQRPDLFAQITEALLEDFKDLKVDYVAGIESRGFLFGPMLAEKLHVPFIPIRKKGKLPRKTISVSYELEYGSAELEMHAGDIAQGAKVLIHDDLLATGGTVAATSKLIHEAGGETIGYSFLVSLEFLNARNTLLKGNIPISALLHYS